MSWWKAGRAWPGVFWRKGLSTGRSSFAPPWSSPTRSPRTYPPTLSRGWCFCLSFFSSATLSCVRARTRWFNHPETWWILHSTVSTIDFSIPVGTLRCCRDVCCLEEGYKDPPRPTQVTARYEASLPPFSSFSVAIYSCGQGWARGCRLHEMGGRRRGMLDKTGTQLARRGRRQLAIIGR